MSKNYVLIRSVIFYAFVFLDYLEEVLLLDSINCLPKIGEGDAD